MEASLIVMIVMMIIIMMSASWRWSGLIVCRSWQSEQSIVISPSDLLSWQLFSCFGRGDDKDRDDPDDDRHHLPRVKIMMMMMIVMIGTICPESTVRLFIAPAILGPPVQVFPL